MCYSTAPPLLHNRPAMRRTMKKSLSVNCDRVRLVLAGLVLVTSGATAHGTAETHQYTISVDYALNRLWIEARFATPVDSVLARSRDAGKFLIDVRGCDHDQNIRMRNRRMLLPEGGIRCLNYTVDLARAARHDKNYRGLSEHNIIVSPSLWLWRPEITSRSQIYAHFRLPSDVRVSVPWQATGDDPNTYLIARSPESVDAEVVFGKFDYAEIDVPGATLRVSLLQDGTEFDQQALFDWVRVTATDVSLAYGRFPNPSPQVIVVPVSGAQRDGAVPYGRVIRNGGEMVQFFISPGRPIEEFMGDWTATHEFSHLMLPYLNRRHRWIAEGFAQYYQNVLLARSGEYDQQHAWQKLYEGFERGHKSRPEMSPNEAAEGGIRTGLMKIYWSGAAIALMADVQLREQSGGKETLDTVLGHLQQCCLPADKVWTGPELFRTLDSFTDQPVFMPLYRRYADTAGFPDPEDLLVQLGLSVNDGKVRLRRNADLSDIRLAITGTDSQAASHRLHVATRK
jgi:M61 glycyl aminopeptidase